MTSRFATVVVLLAMSLPAFASDLDGPPIRYSTADANNLVTKLERRLKAKQDTLTADDEHGYLRSLLTALDVPVSSQVLVFSKTSLQRSRIGPKTPRAIYFNDEVSVGYCRHGDVLEIVAADPNLKAGVAYYGSQPKAGIDKITAPLLLHYAGLDERINAGIKNFEAALKANGKAYEIHVYDGVNHAFNNDTNAVRFNKAASGLAWGRTIGFLKKNLA